MDFGSPALAQPSQSLQVFSYRPRDDPPAELLLLWVFLSVLCPRPQVANGRLKSALGSKMQYQTNETVTFECLEGYHFSEDEDVSLEDSQTATCLPDGSWTQLPKCVSTLVWLSPWMDAA